MAVKQNASNNVEGLWGVGVRRESEEGCTQEERLTLTPHVERLAGTVPYSRTGVEPHLMSQNSRRWNRATIGNTQEARWKGAHKKRYQPVMVRHVPAGTDRSKWQHNRGRGLVSPFHCEHAASGSCQVRHSSGQSFLRNSPPSCTGLDLEEEDVWWQSRGRTTSTLIKNLYVL